jgi:hypothetical protein
MYTYAIEFNLAERGREAEDFLHDAVRRWPKLWEEIPGVQGTVLLSNALALGGEFEYQLRVDIDALSTLAAVDETIRSGQGGWRRATAEWFKARTATRARVSQHVAGDRAYARPQDGRAGAIHLVLNPPSSATEHLVGRVDELGSVPGVLSTQALRSTLGSAGAQEQLWLRLESLKALDGLEKAFGDALGGADALGGGQLFGELREVDGALFAGA